MALCSCRQMSVSMHVHTLYLCASVGMREQYVGVFASGNVVNALCFLGLSLCLEENKYSVYFGSYIHVDV